MPKPTLLQNILGRPSRSYAYAVSYNSSRLEPPASEGPYNQDWWADPRGNAYGQGRPSTSSWDVATPRGAQWEKDGGQWEQGTRSVDGLPVMERKAEKKRREKVRVVVQPSTPEVAYKPPTLREPQDVQSPAPGLTYKDPPPPSPSAVQQRPVHASPHPRAPPPPSAPVEPPPPSSPPPPPQQQQPQVNDLPPPSQTEHSDSEESDSDIFLTPPQSPTTSPRNSLAFPTTPPLPPGTNLEEKEAKPLPTPTPHAPKIHAIRPSSPSLENQQPSSHPTADKLSAPPALTTSTSTATITTTTTTTSASEDAYSSYSWANSGSTALTTPSPALSRNPSVSKSVAWAAPPDSQVSQPTPASSSAPPRTASAVPPEAVAQLPPTQEEKPRRRRTSSAEQPEWAREVRWLVDPQELAVQEKKKSEDRLKRRKSLQASPSAPVAPPVSPAMRRENESLKVEGRRVEEGVRELRGKRSSTTVATSGSGETLKPRRQSFDSAPPAQPGRSSSLRSQSPVPVQAWHASSTQSRTSPNPAPPTLARNDSYCSQRSSASGSSGASGSSSAVQRSQSVLSQPKRAPSPLKQEYRPSLSASISAPASSSSTRAPTPAQPPTPTAPYPQARPRPRAHSSRPSQLMAQLRMSDVPELDEEASNELYAGSPGEAIYCPSVPSAPGMSRTSTMSGRASSSAGRVRSPTPTQAASLSELMPDPAHRAPSVRHRTNSAPSRPVSTYSLAPSHHSHQSHSTVLLPSPLPIPAPLPASTQQGYTSLTLPHASYVPSTNPVRAATEGKVDVARLGIGQAAMATVSVIRGAARGGLFRRASRLGRSDRAPQNAEGALAFSVRTPPPARVPSTGALVRVYACALDSLDLLLLHSKLGEGDSAFGYTPGRAFVGHVVEAGWDCPGVSKGDWVVALLEVKKPGGLAEFVVVQRGRMFPCPRPAPAGRGEGLSLAQLAVLPLSGVAAVRAARTASQLGRGGRVLILLGKCEARGCSAGVMCARMLVAQGLGVSVQVEGEEWAERVGGACEAEEVWEGEVGRCLASLAENLAGEDAAPTGRGSGESQRGKDGEPTSGGGRFDLVVDCVGGREIWRAARLVLKDGGQFTTLLGDSPDVAPTMRAQIQSNFKSLRRAFLTPSSSGDAGKAGAGASAVSLGTTLGREKAKRVEYEWVSPLHAADRDGEDVRDSLEQVVASAKEGVGVPFLTLSDGGLQDGEEGDGVELVTMEKAAEAIERMESTGGVVVVKVVG